MIEWALSLLMMLFGFGFGPGIAGMDEMEPANGDLNCASNASGSVTWITNGDTDQGDITATVDITDGIIAVDLLSEKGNRAAASQAASADDGRRLCEAVAAVPTSEWDDDYDWESEYGGQAQDTVDVMMFGSGEGMVMGMTSSLPGAPGAAVVTAAEDISEGLMQKLAPIVDGWS